MTRFTNHNIFTSQRDSQSTSQHDVATFRDSCQSRTWLRSEIHMRAGCGYVQRFISDQDVGMFRDSCQSRTWVCWEIHIHGYVQILRMRAGRGYVQRFTWEQDVGMPENHIRAECRYVCSVRFNLVIWASVNFLLRYRHEQLLENYRRFCCKNQIHTTTMDYALHQSVLFLSNKQKSKHRRLLSHISTD